MAPVHLHRELGVIGSAFVNGGRDDIVLVHRCSDIPGEHADIHPDIPLCLRLYRVMQCQKARAGSRFDDATVETIVQLV